MVKHHNPNIHIPSLRGDIHRTIERLKNITLTIDSTHTDADNMWDHVNWEDVKHFDDKIQEIIEMLQNTKRYISHAAIRHIQHIEHNVKTN